MMSNLDSLTLDLDEQMQNVGNPNWRPKCYGCGQAIPEGEVAAKHSGRVRTLPTDPFALWPVAPPRQSPHPAPTPPTDLFAQNADSGRWAVRNLGLPRRVLQVRQVRARVPQHALRRAGRPVLLPCRSQAAVQQQMRDMVRGNRTPSFRDDVPRTDVGLR